MNRYLAAGAAIGGVLLLDRARSYETAGHKAAAGAWGSTAAPALAPAVGSAAAHAVDAVGAGVVCDQVLAAAHAGAFLVVVNGQGGEVFNPLSTQQWFLGTNLDAGISSGTLASLREALWSALEDGDTSTMSAFGLAVRRVMIARTALNDSTVAEAMSACNALASTMDSLGLLFSAPTDVTPSSWVWDHTIGALLPSGTTVVIGVVAIAGAGYLAWKLGLLGARQ